MNNNLSFIPFTAAQLPDYLRLYQPYYINPQQLADATYRQQLSQTGFMVGEPYRTWEEVPPMEFGLCAVDNAQVVGLIRVDKADSSSLQEEYQMSWHAPLVTQKAYEQEKYVEVGVILVDAAHLHQGIASALFAAALRQLPPQTHIFSWVVSKPVYNTPSMQLHAKLGFTHVGTFNTPTAFGLSPFESYLFHTQV